MSSPAPLPVFRELTDATHRVILNPAPAANDRLAQNDHVDLKADDAAEESDSERNPLWIVAVGMACVFGAMAAGMALT